MSCDGGCYGHESAMINKLQCSEDGLLKAHLRYFAVLLNVLSHAGCIKVENMEKNTSLPRLELKL